MYRYISLVFHFTLDSPCSKEYDTPNVGAEQLRKEGYLDDLKNGPVYWIDTSEVNPVVGMHYAVHGRSREGGEGGGGGGGSSIENN